MKEKSKQINIRVTEDEYDLIKRVANSYGMNMREFLVYAGTQLEKQVTFKSNELDEKRNRTTCSIITDRIGDMERRVLKKMDVFTEMMNMAIKNQVIDIDDKA